MAAKRADSDKPNDGKSPRASWRGSQRAPATAARYSWQQSPDDVRKREVVRKNLRRRLKLAGSAAALLALLGAFIAYLFLRAPATPLLAAALTRYAAPLPPNAWAEEDVKRMISLGKAAPSSGFSGGRGPLEVTAASAQWDSTDSALSEIDGWLQKTRPGGPGKNVVLIYLSAHGVVDGQGRPCLVLAEPEFGDRAAPAAGQSTRWLPVRELVERLDAWRPEVKKLLLLDANRMAANWSIGLLYNAFAEGLADAVGEAKSVAILNSADAGEVGWAGPDLQGSAFGSYVCQALEGDPRADRNRNGRISLQELAAFVRGRTAEWANRNRFDLQSPLLVPADADFNIVWTAPAGASTSTAPEVEELKRGLLATEPTWTAIGKLWDDHARYSQAGDAHGSPARRERCLMWREFERGLVRCEQLALAGGAYRTDAEDALEKLQELSRQLAVREVQSFAVHSLPQAQIWRERSPRADAWRKSLVDFLDDPAKPPAPEAQADYLLRAEAAWSWLAAGDADAALARLQPAQIRRALELAGVPGESQRAELAEMHFLRLLAGEATFAEGSNLPQAAWSAAGAGILAALKARESAERAVAIADERAQYAAAPFITVGDTSLRKAEDALFVGRKIDLEHAESFRQAALASYQQAQARADRASKAFATRDRAWSELSYLAEWYARRRSPMASAESAQRDEVLLESVMRTIGRAHELEALLERHVGICQRDAEAPQQAAEATELEAQLDALSSQVVTSLDGLLGAYKQRVQQVLEQQTSDERTLRDLDPFLTSPLASGALRRQLHQRYLDELVSRIAGNAVPADADASQAAENADASGAEAPRGYLEQVSNWTEHPALAILNPAGTQGSKAAEAPRGEPAWRRLARQGDEVRRLLAEALRPAPRPAASAGPASSDPDASSPLAAARSALSRAERTLRIAAPLCAGTLAEDEDPTLRLVQFDRNRLLAWHARRRLDDFWGSGGAATDAPPYFADAFQDCRAAARQLNASGPEVWQPLAEACNSLEQAARSQVFPPPTSDEPRLRRRMLEKSISLEIPAQLPPGTAALFVEDAWDRPTEIRDKSADGDEFAARAPIAAKAGGAAAFEAVIRCAAASDASGDGAQTPEMPQGKPWKLVWFYRGHRQTGEFHVRPIGKGIELAYHRRLPEPATVIVEGEGSKEASVAFVLDCSGSMGALIAGEQTTTRMAKAREALVEIVEELSATESYRVGLWLYGHRWGRDKAGTEVWNAAWGPANKALLIGDDVEQVVPLELLSKQSKNKLLALLGDANRVQAWGQTPLYLAIVEALRQYQQLPQRGPRRLVVITDGKDDQPFDKSRKFTTREEVRKAVLADRRANPGSPVRIQVLDCAPTERSNLRDLIKDELGGDYIPVTAWGELERKLQDALGLVDYEAAPADAASGAAAVEERVGLPATVKDAFGPGQKFRYEVRLLGRTPAVRSPIELAGGEAIKLTLSRKDGAERLIHERYERGGQTELESSVSPHTLNPAAQPGAVDADFNPAEFYIAAHRPEVRPGGGQAGNTLAFPISIQNADPQHFSPRPAEAWIEITPIVANEPTAGEQTAGPYPFCDLSFEPQRPVPVLDCVVPDWPATARAAELRIWLKLVRTRPTLEATIAELETNPGQLRKLRLPGAANVELGLQTEDAAAGCRMIVDEEHPVEQPAVEWLRIESLGPADEIRRTYNYEGRFARHEFLYRGKTRSQVRSDKLQINARRELQDGAIAVDKPLRVVIYD